MIVLLDHCFRARTIAVSMAIQGRRRPPPHPLAGRSASVGWRESDFVVSRGMAAQPSGEESRSELLRHRRSRRSRPSVRSGH
ncbi:MAG: hypothetical protein E5W82_24640 [Mesorhizobium sp.]|nr:MAG: hypothetical protein E5W82_24640 [Mesorhizobium sp.]